MSTGATDTVAPIDAGDPAADARFRARVWVVALVALAARLVLQHFEPPPPSKSVLADEVWFTAVAHNVVAGRGFISPLYPFANSQTALHGPLTVLLLVPATIVHSQGFTVLRMTMAVIGALTVVAVAYVGRELGAHRVGLVAAVLAAVYPGLWVNDLVATSESPAILLLAVILLLALRYRRRPTTGGLVLMGLSLGLLALDRAELCVLGLLLVVPAVVAAARRDSRRAETTIRGILVVCLLSVLVVLPWSAYNQVRFHQTVLISNNLGQTLIGANCRASYYGPLTGYDGRFCYRKAFDQLPKGSNEVRADAFMRHRAIQFATAHWHRWPVVAVMRELWLWSLWRPGWTVHMSALFLGRAAWLAWSQIVAFWLLAPFAIYGFFVARRRKVPVAPLVTMVAFTAALGLLVVGHLRYRVPTELAFVLLGAFAFDELVFARRARAGTT